MQIGWDVFGSGCVGWDGRRLEKGVGGVEWGGCRRKMLVGWSGEAMEKRGLGGDGWGGVGCRWGGEGCLRFYSGHGGCD